MINLIINNQEAIVNTLTGFSQLHQTSTLSLSGLLQGLHASANMLHIDSRQDSWIAKFEDVKRACIYIVVNQYHLTLSYSNQLFGKKPCIQYLTFIEDALNWGHIGTDKEIYLSLLTIQPLLNLRET